MPRVQVRAPKTAPRKGPKTDWVLIEGNGRTVIKTIAGILNKTGDDSFEVEFRIFRSSQTGKAATRPKAKPQRAKRRLGLGSLTTIFVPRRKRKH